TTQDRLNTQHWEEIRGDDPHAQASCLGARNSQGPRVVAIRNQILKGGITLAEVLKVRIACQRIHLLRDRPDGNEPAARREWKRPQQDSIHNTYDRCICADTYCKRADNGRREARTLT